MYSSRIERRKTNLIKPERIERLVLEAVNRLWVDQQSLTLEELVNDLDMQPYLVALVFNSLVNKGKLQMTRLREYMH